MKLTPLDIRKQEFGARVRGVDREEVQAFLQMVASQWEELLDEQRRLEEKVRDLDSKLQHYRNVEEALQEALRTARESAKESLETARKKAGMVVAEAEGKAADINRAAKEERRRLKRQVSRLSNRHEEVLSRLRAFLTAEMELLSRYDGHDSMDFLRPLAVADAEEHDIAEAEIRAKNPALHVVSPARAEPVTSGDDAGPDLDEDPEDEEASVPLPPWAVFEKNEQNVEMLPSGLDQPEAASSEPIPDRTHEIADIAAGEAKEERTPTLAEDAQSADLIADDQDEPELPAEQYVPIESAKSDESDAYTAVTGDGANHFEDEAPVDPAPESHPEQVAPPSVGDEDQPSDGQSGSRWISHRVFSALRSSGRSASDPAPDHAFVDEAERSWTPDPEETEVQKPADDDNDDNGEQLSISSDEVERIRRILKGLDHA